MKLILSLTLILTLSSTAKAVECWIGEGNDPDRLFPFPCNSTDLCATIAEQTNKNGNLSQSTFKVCLPSSLFSKGNHIFSFNVGFEAVTASVYLCNTDRCNNKTIPYPDVMKQNKLQCFGCDDPSSAVCNKTVQCVGEQDRCINGTVEVQNGVMFHTFGCVSENLCKVASYLESLPMPLPFKFLRAPKCCESSFCNSAWSVKLNVMLLLFGLFTLIVY